MLQPIDYPSSGVTTPRRSLISRTRFQRTESVPALLTICELKSVPHRHDSANSISYERSASKLCDGSFSGRNYNEGSDSDSSSPRSKREAPEKPALRFTFQSQCLCDFHSLPQQLRFNKFVHSGYRVRYRCGVRSILPGSARARASETRLCRSGIRFLCVRRLPLNMLRFCLGSMRECVQSLVQWHNESLNIFSHMAALVLVVRSMPCLCRLGRGSRGHGLP